MFLPPCRIQPSWCESRRKVVWYDTRNKRLVDLKTFLEHVMVGGSPAGVARYSGMEPRLRAELAIRAV